ncbi:MAG: winged helix DNA-binding domain-containing protein, partial [Actinomycetota bacterium]
WWRGQIVGGWTQREDGAVVTSLFDTATASLQDALAAEAGRLEAWLGDLRVRWRYPTPLQKSLENE